MTPPPISRAPLVRLDVRRTEEISDATAEEFRADLEVQLHREAGEEDPGWQERLSAFARDRAAHYGIDIRITPAPEGFVFDLMHIQGRDEEV